MLETSSEASKNCPLASGSANHEFGEALSEKTNIVLFKLILT